MLPPNGVIVISEGGPNSYSDTKRLPAGRIISPKMDQKANQDQPKNEKKKSLN